MFDSRRVHVNTVNDVDKSIKATFSLIINELFSLHNTNIEKERSRLTKEYREHIQKIFLQLKENPYVGDQLRYKNLREKRIREKRVYYLVYDDLQAVLIVAVGGKKDQQATINHIIHYFDEYRKYLENILAENSKD